MVTATQTTTGAPAHTITGTTTGTGAEVVTGPAASTAEDTAHTVVTPEAVRAVLATVPDPEMPPVSIADLGMVVDVAVDPAGGEAGGDGGAAVRVDLVPTFSGCPATAMIAEQVEQAVADLDGVARVDVRFVRHVTWEPARITERGRERLRGFGIAPPGSGQEAAGGAGGVMVPLGGVGGVVCPLCGSRDTVADSPFGPTPCRSTYYCRACRNPFEAVKP